MDYNFAEIEKKWQAWWAENQTFRVQVAPDKPKFYVLDMFPYPSGAGLHVGHPLGYIASDIYSRFRRLRGFNVLHPMGYDAYGLPAEQYAIQTGQHPEVTTAANIQRYRQQLDKLGFSFDWSREVKTCDPAYYKWTQWVFIRLFNSFYSYEKNKALPIAELVQAFEASGAAGLHVACGKELSFSAADWHAMSEKEKQETLMNYRLAYLGDTMVNWCAALGTVLANDEVVNGVSLRGGYPVEQKVMRQWCLRVSAYAERLLNGLDDIDWTVSLKETQRNWIGRSEGAEIHLPLTPSKGGGTGTLQKETGVPRKGVPHYHTTGKLYWNSNIDNARAMRKSPTQAENILWEMLRAKNMGYRFRRQHLIGNFIADFVCLEKKLVIEVDGGHHKAAGQKEYDEQRTCFLNEHDFYVLRVTNEEVLADTAAVLQKITRRLNVPPSSGGGRGEVVVFTTRPDTIFGVTFMVLAPESDYVPEVVTPRQQQAVNDYLASAKRRTERERMSGHKVTGVFSGSYALHPLTGEPLPVWISDYVLAGYGTGAIMAVPAHDSRDYAFAKQFGKELRAQLGGKDPVVPLIEGCDVSMESFDAKEGKMINSPQAGCPCRLTLNGLDVQEAIAKTKEYIEEYDLGRIRVNYRLRDAIFSRQRYWGEPFPVYYDACGMPQALPEEALPLELPEVDKFLPTGTGEPPLSRAAHWAWDSVRKKVVATADIDNKTVFALERNTMPGFAGSSAYYLRYMDPHNEEALVSRENNEYWRNVDLYIGGTEHATGHLIYSRFWNKFLFDLGVVCESEPFKKLINQGMIQGRSNFVYRIQNTNTFVSLNLKDRYDVTPLHVDVNMVSNDVLDVDKFRAWRPEFAGAEFILEDGKYLCGWAVEKMSKSMYNVVNPDDIVEKYGADTLRMYEMFLGPLEQSKPWDTNGIDGVHRFLKKYWRLFFEGDAFAVSDEPAGTQELKILHRLIKKIQVDVENFSFNTSVSAFMIGVNELAELKCRKRAILQPLTVLLSPFAPHICEELWSLLGRSGSIADAAFPEYEEKYMVENSFEYPVSFNGKLRFKKTLPLGIPAREIEAAVLNDEQSAKYMEGKTPKKVIVVEGKIVNVVV
ncbi:MAG: class I tRNA ligase family protein [Prevotellaceae bacterium]|jgi:leucyl-tRNA synthetase|nr:class I tRNA ligase family protein [Prevotellaceae bacterium]